MSSIVDKIENKLKEEALSLVFTDYGTFQELEEYVNNTDSLAFDLKGFQVSEEYENFSSKSLLIKVYQLLALQINAINFYLREQHEEDAKKIS